MMKEYCKILIILLLPLLFVLIYAMGDNTYSFNLEKINVENVPQDNTVEMPTETPDTVVVDSAKQRILFFGDSMVEGLGPRMAQYATHNGHELTYICWYSSNTTCWATDTLRHYLQQIKPTYVMITIGGNEQQTRNLPQCERNIKTILSAIGDIPYIWICTPAWNAEAPFNEIPKRLVGENRFFDSRKLTFERGSDHHHPTFASAAVWMDSIAVWMQSPQAQHPIIMNYPPDGTLKNCTPIYLHSH